jgi:hypothetical protein
MAKKPTKKEKAVQEQPAYTRIDFTQGDDCVVLCVSNRNWLKVPHVLRNIFIDNGIDCYIEETKIAK